MAEDPAHKSHQQAAETAPAHAAGISQGHSFTEDAPAKGPGGRTKYPNKNRGYPKIDLNLTLGNMPTSNPERKETGKDRR